MAKNRPNVIPIIEDARHPQKYRMLVPMVDVVFADVAQPDQVRLHARSAQHQSATPARAVVADTQPLTKYLSVMHHRLHLVMLSMCMSLHSLVHLSGLIMEASVKFAAGTYCGIECTVLPEEWWILCHLHQGQLH